MRTVGVEEEFLLMDARCERARAVATRIVQIATARGDVANGSGGSLVRELQEQQLETHTSPHIAMPALEAELRSWRANAASAAREAGARIVASATCPVAVRTPRYAQIAVQFGVIAREQLTCGCHVHVSVASLQEAVGVLDRIRIWLPCLLALSANSPFWQRGDTGYASFRSQSLGRWPDPAEPGGGDPVPHRGRGPRVAGRC